MNATIARLAEVMNRHDASAMAACFAADYSSDQPVHPNRSFVGNQQVEKNWTGMFAGVPDMTVTVVAEDTVGDRMRLYVEPVERDSAAIEEAVQQLSGAGG